MSEDRPASDSYEEEAHGRQGRATDADAWATACAEDLAAEKARRRAENGPQPGGRRDDGIIIMGTVG
ncbi:DUF5304 family protein, partial [Streptomyces broussonetiae]|uniref:DUF5304 family protein n=1 Tax=Streptomyces broussonetiae TaxID=2686304 RepID=UPI0035DD6CF8